MKKYFKKGFVLICVVAVLLVPFMSACGKKAPPKPPTEKSGEQIPNTK
jgi:predicted small lipoprotein YifL